MAAPLVYYTSLDNVKRILRSSETGKIVRFSDGIKNFFFPDGDNLFLTTESVSIADTYAGIEGYEFTFSDATNFTVMVRNTETSDRRYGGTGDIYTDFTSADGNVIVDFDGWVGTPVADDIVRFSTNSHMSNIDATSFIQDAEIFIDAFLQQNVTFEDIGSYQRLFTSNIPSQVSFAATRIASSFIYTTIFQNNLLPTEARPDGKPVEEITYLFKDAVRVLGMFLKRYTRDQVTSAPRWMARESLIVGAGTEGVGEGIQMPRMDHFETVANMSYAGLLIEDLMLQTVNIETNDDDL